MFAKSIIIVFIALISLGSTLTVTGVGKPRTPITPGVAAGTTVFTLLEILALAYLYTQL